jgi:hypothetical protein
MINIDQAECQLAKFPISDCPSSDRSNHNVSSQLAVSEPLHAVQQLPLHQIGHCPNHRHPISENLKPTKSADPQF